MDVTGVTAAELARATGVSKSQIDKLRQRKVEATNVHDAMLIARYFGQTVEEFCGMTRKKDKAVEIYDAMSQLTPEHREIILAQIRAVAALQRRDDGSKQAPSPAQESDPAQPRQADPKGR